MKPKKQNRNRNRNHSRNRKGRFYWINRLDRLLKKNGAGFIDLHEFDRAVFVSDRQEEHAERVRAHILVKLIDAISDDDGAEYCGPNFDNIIDAANLYPDPFEWFKIDKYMRRHGYRIENL